MSLSIIIVVQEIDYGDQVLEKALEPLFVKEKTKTSYGMFTSPKKFMQDLA